MPHLCYLEQIATFDLRSQCEWHRMARVTGPNCAVTRNSINIYTHTRKNTEIERDKREVQTKIGTNIGIILSQTSGYVCVFSSHLFWTSGLWTYQPGSHRRKVTQDFSSTFLLRCLPLFFSRESFSRSFPSSTVKTNYCVLTNESFSTC